MLKIPLKVTKQSDSHGYWNVSGEYRVVESDGNILALSLAEQTAQDIVQRCNSYEALLAACKEAYELLEDRTNTYPEPCEDVTMLSVMITLKAAIARTEVDDAD